MASNAVASKNSNERQFPWPSDVRVAQVSVGSSVDDPTDYCKIHNLRGDGPGMRTIILGARFEF